MGLSNWFGRRSGLELALERAMAPGGKLHDELRALGEVEVKTAGEAEAICAGLQRVLDGTLESGNRFTSALYSLAVMFQRVEDPECAALPILRTRGTELLAAIFDREMANAKQSEEHMFVLKILARYGTRAGAERVIATVRAGHRPDDYLWSVTLAGFTHDHPHTAAVFAALADPLPQGFCGVALLDAGNAACGESKALKHPFDSEAGAQRLEQWLRDEDPERFSYAVSATAALPFLHSSARDRLLELAFAHPSPQVQLEAARAEAKCGRERGIERLAQMALDVTRSAAARAYLEELGAATAIPEEVQRPDFAARAEFAQWLAHPSELGRPPDRVEVFDHRELRWPPEFEPKPVWLLRYQVSNNEPLEDDDVGVGMVGSVTFCLFGYGLEQRPPEDGYALHCCWEMENGELVSIEKLDDGSAEYDALWKTWQGPALADARLAAVAEIDPRLGTPVRMLAVAPATRGGQAGWAVIGESPGRWYAAAELPPEQTPELILRLDVGRRVLGFAGTVIRSEWLRPKTPRAPEEIVAGYEKLLVAARAAAPDTKADHFRSASALYRHFASYVDARGALQGGARALHVAAAYEAVFAAANEPGPENAKRVYDSVGVFGEQFETLVAALVETGRSAEIMRWVEAFAPHWDCNLGRGMLGAAAFQAGANGVAETLLVKLKASDEQWWRGDRMPLLARIQHRTGRADEARELLATCLQNIAHESRDATGSDRELFEGWFQAHRRTCLELFPGIEAQLAERGIPASTLGRE